MKIAVFASGTGTTLQTLIEQQAQYGYQVSLVVANRACMAMERAEKHGIPVLLSKNWEEIDLLLRQYDVELIVLAGFLAIIPQWICAASGLAMSQTSATFLSRLEFRNP